VSRVTPYQPMGQPQKQVTQDRMQEILSQNSSKATQSRNEKSSLRIDWQQPVWTNAEKTAGYIISACERFMVDRYQDSYNAYERATRSRPHSLPLGNARSADDAKALCQARANGAP
jgi:hypothetical protein